MAILSAEAATSVIANGLLMAINLWGCMKSRSVGTAELILGALGATRLCFQFALFLNYIMQFFFPSFISEEGFNKPFMVIWMFFYFASLWCATWLCTFYCVKVANVSSPIFACVKRGFSKWLPWLLAMSWLWSMGCALLVLANVDGMFSNSSSPFSGGNTPPAFMAKTSLKSWIFVCLMGSSPPSLLFAVAAGLLVASLCRHARQMQGGDTGGFRSPSIKAHVGAVKAVTFFFLFYTSFVITLNISASGVVQSEGWENCLCALVISAYPSLNSVWLILSNPKLRNGSLRILYCGTRSPGSGDASQGMSTIT
ncbi:taste receptor type 2 member 39-like [Lissotriton helveticus]